MKETDLTCSRKFKAKGSSELRTTDEQLDYSDLLEPGVDHFTQPPADQPTYPVAPGIAVTVMKKRKLERILDGQKAQPRIIKRGAPRDLSPTTAYKKESESSGEGERTEYKGIKWERLWTGELLVWKATIAQRGRTPLCCGERPVETNHAEARRT